MTKHARERIALRHWLLGRGWFKAAEGLTFAEGYHNGTRKDGVTPEFSHQVNIALYVATLTPHLRHPEASVLVSLLHDVCEDYDVEFHVIEAKFGREVADATRAMTKVHKGIKRAPAEVAAAQAEDPIASVNKGADRIHNQSTMAGVFSPEKILAYIDETEEYILPMLKQARRNFPDQDGAYQNIRTVLTSQNHAMRYFATTLTSS